MEASPRPLCLRCLRPQRVCYCAHLPSLPTRTRIVLLQHPREARMPIGTARMAHLALPTSELHRGVFFHDHARVNELLAEPGTALLFPSDGATDPHEVAPEQVRNLIVIDGTWWQARKVLKQNPQLQRLPRIGLRPEKPGNYRIRREPSAECLATLEAVSGVLGILEGDPEKFDRMLAAFTFMVDQQIAHAAARTSPVRQKRPRFRDPSDEQRLLAARDSLVLAHGEANSHSRRANVEGRPELIHLVAHRANGDTFESMVAPRRPLAPNAAFHMEVPSEQLLGGESVESLRERWAAFSRPGDIVAGWGTYTAHLLAVEGIPSDFIDLRAVVARRLQDRPGSAREAISELGGGPAPMVGTGRAGRTVGELVRVVAALAERPRRVRRGTEPSRVLAV